jgi:hypothetical protein
LAGLHRAERNVAERLLRLATAHNNRDDRCPLLNRLSRRPGYRPNQDGRRFTSFQPPSLPWKPTDHPIFLPRGIVAH